MVKILFFGMLSSKTGTKETTIDITGDAKLADIIAEIKTRYADLPDGPFIYAVNEEQATPDKPIKDGDEIAIMPPFAGG
jgi:molybdopterin converting factor small subunit